MAKLNRRLIASIITDIGELVRVGNEIYSWLGGAEHLSWKFPTKTAKDINAMEIVEQHEGSAGEFYVLLLELAYDRVHFILRLIVEFANKHPFVENVPKDEQSQSYMSVANIVHLFWDRLKTISESLTENLQRQAMKDSNREKRSVRSTSRCTQTAESCLNSCESCRVASQAVLRIMNAIEGAFREIELPSTTAAARERARDDIYEETQWAVMNGLTAAIEVDVKATLEMMRESDSKKNAIKRNYEDILESMRVELAQKESEMDILRTRNAELDERIQNDAEQLKTLSRNNSNFEIKNEELSKVVEDVREETRCLVEGNRILQSQAANLAENKLELENCVRRLQKEAVEARDACLETKRNLRDQLTNLQAENDSIKKEYEEKIEVLQREISTTRDKMKNLESSRKTEKRGGESTVEGNRNDGSSEEKVLMPGDDPELDMTRQLIANRRKIEVLSRQNDRLSKTLSRLREYRLTEQTRTNEDLVK